MQIILVSNRLATAKTITLRKRHLAALAVLMIGSVLFFSSAFSFLTLRMADRIRIPVVQDLLAGLRLQEAERARSFVRDNVDAMAVKLGELQAKLVRLESVGDRVAQFAGLKPADLRLGEPAAQGGPIAGSAYPLTADDLRRQVEALSLRVDRHADVFGLIESQMFEERVRAYTQPTELPIPGAWGTSDFGWRVDPFNGHRAMHTGVDFQGGVGTPIKAAAGGVVTAAEYHAQYGWYVDIDHGNDLVTRYAHCHKLHVKPGAIVRPGQVIAEVGSTGRSTGPHLHFEIRVAGAPQNPNRFLQRARDGVRLSAR